MSETYVVALTKHYHARGIFADIPASSKMLGTVDFVIDKWTTEHEQRMVMRDAAESFFYAIAEALVEYEIEEPLINDTPESGMYPAMYWGQFIAEDDTAHMSYEVTIFRHYFAPSLFDNVVAAGRRL